MPQISPEAPSQPSQASPSDKQAQKPAAQPAAAPTQPTGAPAQKQQYFLNPATGSYEPLQNQPPAAPAPTFLSPATGSYEPLQGDAGLKNTRAGITQELQNDPETRRLLMASTAAEVGGQGSQAQQAYIESVFNRANAQGSSLKSVLLDPHYYPEATRSKLGATLSQDQQQQYQKVIDLVTGGSNISNMATGNESGDVHSGGAQVTYSAGGERFVAENWTTDWRNLME
jgi:hypothetical protein